MCAVLDLTMSDSLSRILTPGLFTPKGFPTNSSILSSTLPPECKRSIPDESGSQPFRNCLGSRFRLTLPYNNYEGYYRVLIINIDIMLFYK